MLTETTSDDSLRAQSEQIQIDSDHFKNPFVQFNSTSLVQSSEIWEAHNNCWNICSEDISQFSQSAHGTVRTAVGAAAQDSWPVLQIFWNHVMVLCVEQMEIEAVINWRSWHSLLDPLVCS